MSDDLDDLMDARLRAAGERWRKANTDVPAAGVPADAVVQAAPPAARRRRTGLLVSAAVVAAALAVGGAVALGTLGSDDAAPAGGKGDLVGQVWQLHDGDQKSSATLYVSRKGALVADDECTVVGATVTPKGGALRATEIQVRHRDCTDQYGPRLGDDFAKALRANPEFSARAKKLSVGKYDFTAAPQLPRPTIDVPAWEEAKWKLVRVKDAAGTSQPLPPKRDLRVHDGVLTTSDGCNGFSGPVERNGDSVRFSPGRSTLIGCAGQQVIEPVLFTSGFTAKVVGAELTISKAGEGSLVYEWVPDNANATDVSALTRSTWRLTTADGKPAKGTTTLRFPDTRTFDYADSCGTTNGVAELRRGFMSLSLSDATCASAVKALRSRIRAGLWSIRDGALRITDPNGPQSNALVFAGGRTSPPVADTLTGTWVLTQVRKGARVASMNPTQHALTLNFSGTRLTITDVCTERSGTYSTSDGTLRLRESRLKDGLTCAAKGIYTDSTARGLAQGAQYSRRSDELRIVLGAITLTFEKK